MSRGSSLRRVVSGLFAASFALTLVFASSALSGVAAGAQASQPGAAGSVLNAVRVCGAVPAGFARCHALVAKPNKICIINCPPPPPPPPPPPGGCSSGNPSGYHPCELQKAYNLPSSTAGNGQTIAIVDAFDDPRAESDLQTYRNTFGLPACTTSNGCFRKVNQSGGTTPPGGNASWGLEISLDVDMVSAACPNCHILLVEANTNATANLAASVNTAARLGATAISNSYGASESSGETASDSSYNHPGIMVTASSGDSGFGVQYPAASQYVTAVGGTSLTAASNARGYTETAWSGAGSGCSAYEAKPSWQTDTAGCGKRTVADVSAVADPNTGVAVYDTYCTTVKFLCPANWQVVGGTSVASPLIAAVYGLAGNGASLTYGSDSYSHLSSLNDVTSGNNGSCSPAYLCTAGPGYDGPTGNGTPAGTGAF